jgi:hypothetical protein
MASLSSLAYLLLDLQVPPEQASLLIENAYNLQAA